VKEIRNMTEHDKFNYETEPIDFVVFAGSNEDATIKCHAAARSEE